MVNCKLNQIFLGEVASIQNYGAFVRIPGSPTQGLIHKSQVSSAHVEDVADVLQRGERVWCKVISVGDDGKIGLSMKHVNQGDGTDLDPNGVELQRDMQKRKTVGKYERKKIQLEAVLNTTCTKCGTAGHLSNDCFMSPDGKKYELLPEIEDIPVQPQSETSDKQKKHKQKKLKKKKKVKKSKLDTDISDSDDKEMVKKKKKKYSKDQKKKKKRHNSSSSDENSSDSSSSHDVKAHKRKHSESSETRTKKCKHSKSKHPDR